MWDLKSADRLKLWREFRLSLDNYQLFEALERVSNLWSFAPFVDYYLDPAKPSEWPSPWDLLHENYYCDLAKTSGMLYTIALSKHGRCNKLELSILKHKKKKHCINILSVNNELVLNYEFNSIVNRQKLSNFYLCVYNYTAEELNIKSYF
jgi:hypothetical protein